MAENNSGRAHLIAGVFRRLRWPGTTTISPLAAAGLLAEQDIPASVANDFADVEKWLPVSQLLITYVAGPYPMPYKPAPSSAGWRRVAIGWRCTGPAAAALSGSRACAIVVPSRPSTTRSSAAAS